MPATRADIDALTAQLGREPQADFEVVVRGDDGSLVVVRNAPFLHDGTPMPTLYWLVDPELTRAISYLESHGGVRAAESAVDRDDLIMAHIAYAAERDTTIPAGHPGPFPFGGVAGSRKGVKCLHAHYAYFLVGGTDPVGAWVQARLDEKAHEHKSTIAR